MILIGTLSDSCPVWYPHYGSWLVCLVAEVTLVALELGQGGCSNTFAYVQVAIQACRILALIFLPTVLFLTAPASNAKDEESASLLGHDKTSNTAATSAVNSTYGAISATSDDAEDTDSDDDDWYEVHDKKKIELQERLRAKGNCFTYVHAYTLSFSYKSQIQRQTRIL